jgi:hypothetical protein
MRLQMKLFLPRAVGIVDGFGLTKHGPNSARVEPPLTSRWRQGGDRYSQRGIGGILRISRVEIRA